jgi:O-acetyl-ADP-ribose deacetylase (regulator of RNase III)
MKIQLVDQNIDVCRYWEKEFYGCDDVVVHRGDFFSLPTDCVVSPANSFGFMDGGLDWAISQKLGWGVQDRLQQLIKDYCDGELVVGLAEILESDNKDIPYCISAPTMRVPDDITGTVNVYLAASAVFRLMKRFDKGQRNLIQTVTMSGLGTGCGGVSPSVCARQMKKAYDDVWLGQKRFPDSWKDAQREQMEMT